MTSALRKILRSGGAGLALLATASLGMAPASKAPPSTRAAPQPRPQAPRDLQDRISELGKCFDGQVGIAVKSIDDSWIDVSNANELCPQQSVSKLWVSSAVLDAVDRGKL